MALALPAVAAKPPALHYRFASPPPYAHQRRALTRIYHLGGVAALHMPMRSGKSRVAIDWAGIAYRNFGLRRVLVVCPLSVTGVWQQQIEEFCPVPGAVRVLNGSTTARLHALAALQTLTSPDWIEWVIVNYEGTWRKAGKVSMTDALADWKPDLVIADEAHRLKGATSRQSKALAKIAKVAKYRLGLTGTPVTKSPLDIFGQYRFLDERIFTREDGRPASWTWFRNEYATWGTGPAQYVVKGYRKLPELIGKIKDHSYAVKLEDCFDLPPKTFIDVPVAMPQSTRAVYRDMAKQMIAYLESGAVVTADIVLTKLLRLSQITSGFVTDPGGILHELDTAKLDACLDMIEDFSAAGEKVVVFCRFKHDYHALAQALSARDAGYLSLTGETPARSRDDVIRAFHTDKTKMVFIAQTAAGSLGIDLTPARMAIFMSLDYNTATYLQAQDRIYGPKQPHPVVIHHLLTPRTIDGVVLRTLKHGTDLAYAILHDPRRLLLEGLDGSESAY